VVEGSGAVGVAALLAGRVGCRGRRVVAVLSGGNIDLGVLGPMLHP
jgi:threonine dehydratase